MTKIKDPYKEKYATENQTNTKGEEHLLDHEGYQKGKYLFHNFPHNVTIYYHGNTIYATIFSRILGKVAVFEERYCIPIHTYHICLSVINIIEMDKGVSFFK